LGAVVIARIAGLAPRSIDAGGIFQLAARWAGQADFLAEEGLMVGGGLSLKHRHAGSIDAELRGALNKAAIGGDRGQVQPAQLLVDLDAGAIIALARPAIGVFRLFVLLKPGVMPSDVRLPKRAAISGLAKLGSALIVQSWPGARAGAAVIADDIDAEIVEGW
jgi:hypothetical protein